MSKSQEKTTKHTKKKKNPDECDPYAAAAVAAAAAAAKSLQSCLTLCDPKDGSPPGSPALGFSRQEHWSGVPSPSPVTPILLTKYYGAIKKEFCHLQ